MLVKDFQSNPYLNAKPLQPMCSRLVVAADHALATLKDIELKTLHEHIELTIADSGLDDRQFQDDLQFGGERVFYLNGFLAKKNSILMGLGYGWVPDYLIEQELASGALVELDFVGGASHNFTPKLVHSSQRPLGRAGQLLSELILTEFADK